MVFDAMPAAHDFARQRRLRRHSITNAEKRGDASVRIEEIENLRRNLWIRSIVKGNCDLAGRRRCGW
jgi:hypothetical protein